jgi:hypothetical protein
MRIVHQLPTTSGVTGDLARQLARLVGPAVQAPDGSLASCEYLALGESLGDVRAALLTALADALPTAATTDAALAAWEEHLGLPIHTERTDAERQAAIVARVRAIGGSKQRIRRAVATLAGGAVLVGEWAFSDVLGNPVMVHRFDVDLPTALFTDEAFRAELDELLSRQAPAHTTWTIAGPDGLFRFDDVDNGFDRGVFNT